jgi:hypothetical protein
VTVTVAFALAAALSNAIHLMTQHTASAGVSDEHRRWQLVLYLIRQPLWLLGWAAAAAGFVFQAIALHSGQLSVVQSWSLHCSSAAFGSASTLRRERGSLLS